MVNREKKGSDKYRGFLPDMLRKLQARLQFEYELYEVEVRCADVFCSLLRLLCGAAHKCGVVLVCTNRVYDILPHYLLIHMYSTCMMNPSQIFLKSNARAKIWRGKMKSSLLITLYDYR